MQIANFFLGTFWVTAVAIVWFCTDWFVHYTQLFGILENMRLRYTSYIMGGEGRYFPEFLHQISLTNPNRFAKFILKLVSCPFCLLAWLSVIAGSILGSLALIAPIYVCSLVILMHVKSKM
jgi:hypothetical protein